MDEDADASLKVCINQETGNMLTLDELLKLVNHQDMHIRRANKSYEKLNGLCKELQKQNIRLKMDADEKNSKLKEETLTISDDGDESCNNCSYRYNDGFCMLQLFYPSIDHHCNEWTDKQIRFNYEVVHKLCLDYIKIWERYERDEEYHRQNSSCYFNRELDDFILQCCLNDLHREMSLWETKR